ncbi:hypothetical protein FHETE_9747 [Fusarium heterosporum]|uniref:Uncharacterized protein n=1 Tax=Fusarium heterosporum TaxID=42747 RepID=A0A8H5WDQ0_FUSHE|nr:hypothetical protein FHETE_9747 [Fusarium heterosporum]
MKSSTALIALAVVAKASPLAKREWPWESKEALCGETSWKLSTEAGADEVWEKTGASDELDRAIMGQWEHETNWTYNLAHRLTNGKGRLDIVGCTVFSTGCAVPEPDCEKHFDMYGTLPDGTPDSVGRTAYWIFQAVKGMNSKFQMIYNALVEQTLLSNLLIGQMVEDFKGNEDQTGDVLKWLSVAMGLGSTVAGIAPGGAGEVITTGFDIMGGIFDIVAEETAPEEIDQGTISAALADLFTATSEQLKKTLRLSQGHFYQGESIDILSKELPASNKYGPWIHSPVTKFFNGGWFLLNDNSEPVMSLISSIAGSIQPKIANNIMKAANIRLVADKRIGSQEDCGYATGRQWMNFKDSEQYCFYLMRFDEHGLHGAKWTEATEDVYANMVKYNLGNRDPYYSAILDCATSPEKGLTSANLGVNNIPVCFFDLEAYFLEHNDGPECTSNLINKSCNPIKSTPIE